MLKFPMQFEVCSLGADKISETWGSRAGALPPILCAIPPEFTGPGGGYSPEDFFALSIVNCIIATYKVYCEKEKIRFDQIEGKANLIVDIQEGRLTVTQIDIALHVSNASDPERARSTLERAIRDCAISNAIKAGKTFNISVT